MSKKLLADLRSFAETTSVRGIPRVMKAKTRVTFFIWTLGVLLCAALLVWQLSVVLTRYFQYPVNTLTVQASAWQTPTFPDITICNNNPNVYGQSILNSDSSLNSSFSYMMNEPPIAFYYYLDWNFMPTSSGRISQAWDPWYYKCSTLRPQNYSDRESISCLYAILYVDQVTDEPNGDNGAYEGDLDASGLSLLVHAPGTAPDMAFGVSIAPGTETNILLTQSVRTRLGPPYSNCTNQQHLTGDETSDVYTQRYCVNTCIQQKIVDQFGCVSIYFSQYTTAQLIKVNFKICEIENSSEKTLMHKFRKMSAVCSAECVLPCSEYKFDAAVNVVPWPRASQLSSLSRTWLSDPIYRHLVNLAANATQAEIQNATSTSTTTSLFKSRFLQLNVQFGDQSFIELKDVAAFSADAMGAQIGGVLSLWLGVTVMFAFEAFEFIFVYLTNYCKKEPAQTSTASSAETKLPQHVIVQME